VAKRVRHDLTKVTDVDSNAFYRSTVGCLMSDLGDRSADREFVHSASLEKHLVAGCLDNGPSGI
jgi:hypothetical protein